MKVHDRLNATEELDLDVLAGSAIEKVGDIGEGRVDVPADTTVGYRKVVRFADKTSFRIDRKQLVKVHERPDRRTLTLSGPGIEAWLKDTLLVPYSGDDWPQPSVRRFDWTAPEIDAETLWDDTLYVQPRDNLLWGANRPTAWPDPFSEWLHTLPWTDAHPAGVQYYHRNVTTAAPMFWAVTASDEFVSAVDGAELQATQLAGPTDNTVWPYTWRHVLRQIPAGEHTLRLKVTVVNSTGAAGFISSGFNVGGVGVADPLFVSGVGAADAVDGGWYGIDNPTPAPGLRATRIMEIALAEAAARGCDVPTATFTSTLDSAGATSPFMPGFAIAVPCNLWDLAKALGFEVHMQPDSWALDLYHTRGGSSGVSWAAGTDVLEHRIEGVA